MRLTTAQRANSTTNEPKVRPQRRRRNWLAISFVLLVLAPIMAGSWFWINMASDRYVSGAGFSVRSMEQGSGDLLGGLTGMASSGSTSSDSYIVMEFIESRAMVERIEAVKPFSEIFSGSGIDPLFSMEANAGIEEKVEYWQSRVGTQYDSSSGIVAFDVEAFNADDALLLSDIVLSSAGDMVNKLSESARNQAMANAEAEVERAETRLRNAMIDMRRFRDKYGNIDPTATAAARLEVDTQVEAELTDIRARISVLSKQVRSNSPQLLALRSREEALMEQEGVSLDRKVVTAAQLEEYEAIQIEKQFAQQSYTTALSSLEAARVQADGQQRYLAVFSDPAKAEVALRPDRVMNIGILVICAFCFWGIGTLVTYSVRDHMS